MVQQNKLNLIQTLNSLIESKPDPRNNVEKDYKDIPVGDFVCVPGG